MNAKAPLAETVGWTDLDLRAVDTVRVLAADAVEKVGNGHPGTAISLAPAAYLLYQNVLRHDPADPHWLGRDRFVLSAGHSSLTQYIQLYLAGFGLELEDLEALRTWGSKTPGHPEYRHTTGVEITTGPLGQGLASAVGFAMAARRERGLLDPEAAPGTSPFDHHVYVIASDGDLQEGVTSEASSIAGTQELGNLIVLWDDNHISIEGDTEIAFTEDVVARYEAYGWHAQFVDWTGGPDGYREDVDALHAAIEAAKAVTDRPSFIGLRTLIAWPTPEQDQRPLVARLQAGRRRDPRPQGAPRLRPREDVRGRPRGPGAHARARRERTAAGEGRVAERVRRVARREPGERRAARPAASPASCPTAGPTRCPCSRRASRVATRAASGEVLSALAPVLPELWGGSADLAGSNNTTMKGEPSFIPAKRSTHEFAGDQFGRTLHFGIREHAMGSILSGIRLHGLTRPYGGTFFTFSDYMRGSVRLAVAHGRAGRSTCGRTTPSASARTARRTSRSSTSPPSARSRA